MDKPQKLTDLQLNIARAVVQGHRVEQIAADLNADASAVRKAMSLPHVRQYINQLHDRADEEAVRLVAAGPWLLMLMQGEADGRTKRSKRRLPKGWKLPQW